MAQITILHLMLTAIKLFWIIHNTLLSIDFQKRPSFCQDIEVFFRIQGLCTSSVLDRLYRFTSRLRSKENWKSLINNINRLIKPLQNGRKMFYGPSGWKLGWESADKLWKISNERSESISHQSMIQFSNHQLPQGFLRSQPIWLCPVILWGLTTGP